MKAYLVGGAVRDELLGLEVKDRDWVVVGATPDDMLKQGFKQVGADFPVFLHPDTGEEYALARTERKQGRGYHGFTVYSTPDVTLEDDLLRRDLTVNAMAKSPDGEVIDPFGGRDDLAARQLRHVSPAFAEDPLRILRTARFAARLQPMGFRIADSTMALMRHMVELGEVDHLVPERVWQEIQRALHEQEPGTFFDVLRQCGALGVLLPELDDPDRFQRSMASLRCVHSGKGRTDVRFSALLSPLDEAAIRHRARALKAPNDCQDLARLTAKLAPAMGQLSVEAPEPLLQVLDEADAWRRPERFDRLLQVFGCTLPSVGPATWERIQQAKGAAADVQARELMARGYKGKALGRAIRDERLRRIASILSSSQE